MGEGLDVPCWEHKDIEFNFPSAPTADQVEKTEYTFHFDGACANKACAGGCVADKRGVVVGGKYVFFGGNVGGNNVAEALSLKVMLEWMLEGFAWNK